MRPSRVLAASVLVLAAVVTTVLLLMNRDPGQPDRNGLLTIAMTEYAFEPSAWTVPAETPITLRFVNNDDVTHQISMGRDVTEADNRAVAFSTDLLEGLDLAVEPATALTIAEQPYAGTAIEVHGGRTVDVEVSFPADRVGEWHVGCFTGLGCHFRAGLDAVLTIVPRES